MLREPISPELRRMVVALAALHVEDRAEVLASLGHTERKRAETLLASFVALEPPVPDRPALAARGYDRTRLSDWLVARIDGRAAPLTPGTCDALCAIAARLYPPPAKPPGLAARLRARWAGGA